MRNGRHHSYLNGGGLICFANSVTDSFRDDVLDATLYFQLAASKKHSKFSDAAAWRSRYFDAMTHFGCNILHREQLGSPVEDIDAWSSIKGQLGKRVSASLMARADQSLKSLALQPRGSVTRGVLSDHTLEQAPRDAYSAPTTCVSMQLGFVQAEPVIDQLFVSFKTTQSMDDLAWTQPWVPERMVGNLEVAWVSAELDEGRFAQFREIFIENLAARRQQLIIGLDEGGV
jgi:hypothetical protein